MPVPELIAHRGAPTRFGPVPLLAETSTQAASVKPLVILVVFGLLSATVLVVLVIPGLDVLLDDWGLARVPEGQGATPDPDASATALHQPIDLCGKPGRGTVVPPVRGR